MRAVNQDVKTVQDDRRDERRRAKGMRRRGRPFWLQRQARPGVASSLARVGASPVRSRHSGEASIYPTIFLNIVLPSENIAFISSDTANSFFTSYSKLRTLLDEETMSVCVRFMARTGGLSNFRPLAASANGSPKTGQASTPLAPRSRAKPGQT